MTPDPPRSGPLARVLVLVLALLAAAWLAVALRDVRLQEEGIRLLQQSPPRPGAALERFRDAQRWNASRQPRQFEAAALFLDGRREAAIAMIEEVLAAEPENRAAWILLASWTRGTDEARSAQAARRAAELDGEAANAR